MRSFKSINPKAPLCFSLLLTILFLQSAICAADVVVQSGQGISFQQVNFTWEPGAVPDSDRGDVEVDIATLRDATEMQSGFINIVTSLGWVVQNLTVFAGFPYPTVSTMFQISPVSGIDIISLDAYVFFSTGPFAVSPIPSGPVPIFPVGSVDFNARGAEIAVDIESDSRFNLAAPSGSPPGTQPPPFQGGAIPLSLVCLQPPHADVETAINQCVPEGVANAFQWLEDQYGIPVPFPHIPGVGGLPPDSLVGNLDVLIGRPAGDGTCVDQALEGKLEFLSNNDLGTLIAVQHQDATAFCGNVGGGNFTAHGLTSIGRGAPTTTFIQNEVCRGEAVEIWWSWAGGGGHSVNVVATWTVLGEPYIAWTNDTNQGTAGGIAMQTSRLPTIGGVPRVIDIDSVDGGVRTVVSQSPTAEVDPCAGTPPAGAIVGTNGPNALVGTPGNDTIFGLGGNDAIDGKGGNDLICGGDGKDRINSGAGDDNADGGAGNNKINGGEGNDTLKGGTGDDAINGGPGNDSLDGDAGFDRLNGGQDTDTCVNGELVVGCP